MSQLLAYDRRPAWLPATVFPYDMSRLGDGAASIAYLDTGEGPQVLLVHIGTWSFVWRDVIAQLVADHRCVALDAPATGLSGGVPRTHATIRNAAASVTRLVETLDLRDITLVFHDLGGPACLLAANKWPDRVASLVAVNTFAWRPSGPLFRGMLALMGSKPMRGLDVATRYLPTLTSTRFGVGRHLDRASRRTFRAGIGRRGTASLHRYFADTRRTDVWPDIERALQHLSDRPLATVFGERNDPLDFQPEWRRRFPHARQFVVPRGNHFPMCDDPATVADAVRSLTKAARPARAHVEL